jgi:hypothetical protein
MAQNNGRTAHPNGRAGKTERSNAVHRNVHRKGCTYRDRYDKSQPPTPFHQEICIHDLDSEFEKLESADNVASAQAAATTSYKDWRDIKSAGVSAQKNRSSLLPLRRVQREKLAIEKLTKEQEALQNYYKLGEPRKCDHRTGLMETCQIWHFVI